MATTAGTKPIVAALCVSGGKSLLEFVYAQQKALSDTEVISARLS